MLLKAHDYTSIILNFFLSVYSGTPPRQLSLKSSNFQGLMGGYPGVVKTKFGEDRSKTLPMGLFFQKFLVESQFYA